MPYIQLAVVTRARVRTRKREKDLEENEIIPRKVTENIVPIKFRYVI